MTSTAHWQFWIDRGGTFTDVVAKRPDGAVLTHKLLSENPERYDDAALQGIRGITRPSAAGFHRRRPALPGGAPR